MRGDGSFGLFVQALWSAFNPRGPTFFRKMVFLLVLGPTRVGRLWWWMWVKYDGIDLNFFFFNFKIQKSRYFDLFLIAMWVQVGHIMILNI